MRSPPHRSFTGDWPLLTDPRYLTPIAAELADDVLRLRRLVRDEAVAPTIEHREGVAQTVGDVVGVEDRDLRRQREPVAAHHVDVHHRDRQDARATPRRSGNRMIRRLSALSSTTRTFMPRK